MHVYRIPCYRVLWGAEWWPVAALGEAKWLWRFSWYRNNRQQRFVSSGKRRYTNADVIIIIIIIIR